MEKVIEVNNLSFAYGKENILNGIDFSIDAGDYVSLMGSNGSGKSTLIKLILGELPPKEGSVKVLGEDPRILKRWHKVGYVPQKGLQSINNFPATAEEIVKANLYHQIGFLKFTKKEHILKTEKALDLVHMSSYSKTLIGNLSGGQQQRVLLARALVGEPEILILDEPTVGVDDQTVESFYKLTKELQELSNITIFMVTHDMERASKYVTRSFCLDKGSIVEISREELFLELKHKHKHPIKNIKGDDN